jgi:hypothetical protein
MSEATDVRDVMVTQILQHPTQVLLGARLLSGPKARSRVGQKVVVPEFRGTS